MQIVYLTAMKFAMIFVMAGLSAGPVVVAQKKLPPAVIFDTDMGPDYDDVGAIALLHAFADKGKCRIPA